VELDHRPLLSQKEIARRNLFHDQGRRKIFLLPVPALEPAGPLHLLRVTQSPVLVRLV
jgi:hypothetical protein